MLMPSLIGELTLGTIRMASECVSESVSDDLPHQMS